MASAPAQRVFLSYARSDGTDLALRLQEDLTAQRFDAWLDKQRIDGGASWTKEIESAIDRANVVLALLTPGSYVSDICRAEQLRSLRAGKRVIPLLALRGADIPLHLETKNYRDFTNLANYGAEFLLLQEDIRTGASDVPLRNEFQRTRTNLVTAPPLPRNYLPRPEDLARLRDGVITDEPGPSVALTALRGMGGIGKTILARALCDDEVVRQAYPDGIVWTTVGKEPAYSVITRMQEVRRALGDEPATNESEPHCINRYRTVLREKAALIIVDDVWRREDIEPFLADSPRSRILFTTRDGAIAAQVGANSHIADLLTPEQSRTMLARWAGVNRESLPEEAAAVIRECGRLPLALSMIGALLRDKQQAYWRRVLTLLQTARAESLQKDHPHAALLSSVHVSVEALSARDRERYLALAVLLEDMPALEVVQQTLWNADEGEAVETAERFIELSLAQRDGEGGSIRLHDLQMDYIRAKHPDQEALRLIHEAVRLSSHVIEKDPRQFASQVIGRLLVHRDEGVIEGFLKQLVEGAPSCWIRPLQPALDPPGTPLLRTLSGHRAFVTAVAVYGNGRRIISASDDATLKVWDLESGQQLRTLSGHRSSLNAVAVYGDGRRALSASNDCTLKVWDLESGQELHTLSGHSSYVSAVAVYGEGRRALSASNDCTLKVWDLESGQELRTFSGHSSSVNAVAVYGDGRRALSASNDRTLKVWDLESGQELRTLSGHSDWVTAVAVYGDGRRALSASVDQTLKVWDLESGQELRTLSGHSLSVSAVAVYGDGRRALSASLDQTLKVWDLESGQELRTLSGHSFAVRAVVVYGDGRRVISASNDQTLKVWNLESGQHLRTLSGHSESVTAVAVYGEGRRAISASSDQTLKVWDLESGQQLRTLSGHSDWVRAVAVYGDGQRAISASSDQTLKLWDLESGQQLRTLSGHRLSVTAVAVYGEGRRVISASNDRTLKIWDLESGQELCTLSGHSDCVTAVAVYGEGRRAISASGDQTLKLWDLESGRQLRTLSGHSNWVNAVAVCGDGRAISVSDDQTFKLWDLESGAVIVTYFADAALIVCTVTSRMFIAGDKRGNVHFLRLEGSDEVPA